MCAGLAVWAGLKKKTQHTKSLLHNAFAPLPGAPLWLGASLTITPIVLATKPAPPLPFVSSDPEQTNRQ